ncbi:hypothetical protein Trydic_g23875 [Trypoxylus dichotomus]
MPSAHATKKYRRVHLETGASWQSGPHGVPLYHVRAPSANIIDAPSFPRAPPATVFERAIGWGSILMEALDVENLEGISMRNHPNSERFIRNIE